MGGRSASSRPGRPYQPAESMVALGGGHGRRALVAWLLRTNRLFGRDERYLRIGQFASAFRTEHWPDGVSPSTISRWETGRLPVPYAAVRRYEAVLGLPDGQLVTIIDTLHRYWASNRPAAPQLEREYARSTDRQRVDALLDLACSDTTMTGLAWDELTARIVAIPDMYVPTRVWSQLCGRLLMEQFIADKLAHRSRSEAFNRLLRYPPSQCAAIDACATLAADRTNLVFIEPLSALDATNHPDASRHVVAQLHDPTNDRALTGALLASARKLESSAFTQSQSRAIAAVATSLLSESGHREATHALAAALLHRLPARAGPAAALAGQLNTARAVLDTGRLQTQGATGASIRRVVASARGQLVREAPGFRDEILPRLVDEILSSPLLDVRRYCAYLIYATPYRGAVAAALACELEHCGASGDVDLVLPFVDALQIVGGPAQRPVLERLTMKPGTPPPVQSAAAWAVGHVKAANGGRHWEAAIDLHMDAWRRRRDSRSAAILSGLVYGLGIARQRAMLKRLRDNPTTPPPVRSASGWWLNIPRAVYESAEQ